MKKVFGYVKNYFTIWWIPVTVNLLVIGVFLLGTLFERDWIIDFSLLILLVNVFGTIISSIVQVVQRRWYFVFPQLGFAALVFYSAPIIFTYSPPDYYGARKEIPKDVRFSSPLDSMPTRKDYEKTILF
ncbi:hypothetical protein ACVWYF_000784 [Hymenobacter sp. UYAg731]